MSTAIYFPGNVYSTYKKQIKEVFKKHDLKWNFVKSGWYGTQGSVDAVFEGSGKPVTMSVTGEVTEMLSKVAKIVGANITIGSEQQSQGYMMDNQEHYISKHYRELIEVGCQEDKAKRLNDAFRNAFVKVYGPKEEKDVNVTMSQ